MELYEIVKRGTIFHGNKEPGKMVSSKMTFPEYYGGTKVEVMC